MPDQAQATLRYRMDGLDLDLGTCELRHNDEVIDLPKLSFDLLTSLVRHAPNVVTIDELIEDVWDGRIVAEETVTQRVKLLRDALVANGYSKQLVTTVRGRGYRLASPVEFADNEAPAPVRPQNHIFRIGIAVALVVALGVASWRMLPGDRLETDDKSIAVLPFADFTADGQAGYVGDGIAEELLNGFAKIPGLRVASRTSSFTFRDQDQDVRTIAEELGVRTVLEGSVRESDGRFRIAVQLIDAVDDRHIWSEQYDRELTDILDIQAEIATAVLDRFQLAQTDVVTDRSRDIDPTAVDTYLRGRHDLRARTATSLESAVDSFEQVIAIQPDYAPAHVALATSYIELSRRGNFSIDEAERRAGSALETALATDNQLPEAHAVLGLLRLSIGDSSGGRAALRRAIELNPNLAEAHLWLGNALRGEGRFDEARALFERVLLLDPMNVAANDALTFDLLESGGYDAAIREFQRRLRIETQTGETYRLMALTARTFGRLDSAVLWAREAVNADPDGPLNINELAMAYSAIGALDLAIKLTDEAYAKAPDNHWIAALRAFTYINSGDFDSLREFTDEQIELVDAAAGALGEADRVRLAMGALAAVHSGDFIEAETRLERALGDPLTSLLEPQFSIGLLGTLAYIYDQNRKPGLAEETRELALDLIEQQQGSVFRRLIYPDTVAGIQLMRGERDGALATMRQAVADGWTGNRGFLYGPLWREFYDSNTEFRALIDELHRRIDAMRESVLP